MANITMAQMAERIGIEDYDSKTASDDVNAKVMSEFNQIGAAMEVVVQLNNTLSAKALKHIASIAEAEDKLIAQFIGTDDLMPSITIGQVAQYMAGNEQIMNRLWKIIETK